jgi:hypothetical protein
MWTSAPPLAVSEEQRKVLETWVPAHSTPQSVVARARIVLLSGEGVPNNRIAKELAISRPTVILWRERFVAGGPQALTEIEAGRGRRPTYTADLVKRIVNATRNMKPDDATHWSCRSMAKVAGVSPATVQRIWDAHGLQPHRVETFKLSRDPKFVEKCQREPKFHPLWELKTHPPLPGYSVGSSARMSPALSFSLSRYELPRMLMVMA